LSHLLTPLLEIASSHCFLQGLGLRCPLLTKNMITAWICALRNGVQCHVHSGISELSRMGRFHTARVNRVVSTVGRALPVFPYEQTLSALVGMSGKCRFCCKSRLRQATNRDSVVLTRISARSIGPSEE